MDIIKSTFSNTEKLPTINEINQVIIFGNDHTSDFHDVRLENSFGIRKEYIKYNFCILSDEFIKSMKKFIYENNLTPISELCAGSGWLSYWLMKYGIEIHSTTDNGDWKSSQKEKHRFVKRRNAQKWIKNHPEVRMFLLSWPYMDNTAYEIWKNMIGGQYLFYIGEDDGGCNANEKFFKAVMNYEIKEWYSDDKFVSFNGIHDRPRIFKKGLSNGKN